MSVETEINEFLIPIWVVNSIDGFITNKISSSSSSNDFWGAHLFAVLKFASVNMQHSQWLRLRHQIENVDIVHETHAIWITNDSAVTTWVASNLVNRNKHSINDNHFQFDLKLQHWTCVWHSHKYLPVFRLTTETISYEQLMMHLGLDWFFTFSGLVFVSRIYLCIYNFFFFILM